MQNNAGRQTFEHRGDETRVSGFGLIGTDWREGDDIVWCWHRREHRRCAASRIWCNGIWRSVFAEWRIGVRERRCWIWIRRESSAKGRIVDQGVCSDIDRIGFVGFIAIVDSACDLQTRSSRQWQTRTCISVRASNVPESVLNLRLEVQEFSVLT